MCETLIFGKMCEVDVPCSCNCGCVDMYVGTCKCSSDSCVTTACTSACKCAGLAKSMCGEYFVDGFTDPRLHASGASCRPELEPHGNVVEGGLGPKL